jgi:phage shock protein A
MATLSHTMNELVQSMVTLAEAQRQADARVTDLARETDERSGQDAARFERDESRVARLEESFTMLVELARGADERLDENAARFDRDESRLARLEESFTMLVALAHRHG